MDNLKYYRRYRYKPFNDEFLTLFTITRTLKNMANNIINNLPNRTSKLYNIYTLDDYNYDDGVGYIHYDIQEYTTIYGHNVSRLDEYR